MARPTPDSEGAPAGTARLRIDQQALESLSAVETDGGTQALRIVRWFETWAL
ncbi:MAG: hypothetical protein ABEJ89_06435 [Haloarculaceae archaeon]